MIYLFFVLPCVIFFGIEIERQVFFDFNYTVFLTKKKSARMTIKCRNLQYYYYTLNSKENAILFYGLDRWTMVGPWNHHGGLVAVSVTLDFTQW